VIDHRRVLDENRIAVTFHAHGRCVRGGEWETGSLPAGGTGAWTTAAIG